MRTNTIPPLPRRRGRMEEHTMKRVLGIGGAVAMGAALLLASPAGATPLDGSAGGASSATTSATIHVPSDFDSAASDTRATGHYEVIGSGLRIYTTGSTSTDKVAEYVTTSTPLSAVGEPALTFTNTTGGGVPGAQLVVDFDGDGSSDGILIGEPGVYGNDWWASNGSKQFVKDAAPSHTGGFGSANHGTLDQWRAAFPKATVLNFGFSLGSGVKGDGVIDSITFAGTEYAFAKDVKLTSKNDCKNGGWATSTKPVYRNQGDCVSSFASGK
jgi:hypothetical protein